MPLHGKSNKYDDSTSFTAIFSSIPSAAQNIEYQSTVKALRKKYYPIEMDPHLTVEEKIKHMEEWWIRSEKALK